MQTALVLEKIKAAAQKAGRSLDDITLVIVTKNHPLEEILPLYQQGFLDFGENRVHEALSKMGPAGIRWHLIGNLQKNKVKKVIGKFHLIHSVDSLELAKTLSKASGEAHLTTRILLQVNVSGEATKQGLSPQEWEKVKDEVFSLPHLAIDGLMTMAPLTEDRALIRRVFRDLRIMRDKWGLKQWKFYREYSFLTPHVVITGNFDSIFFRDRNSKPTCWVFPGENPACWLGVPENEMEVRVSLHTVRACVAAQVLENLNVNLKEVRKEVLKELETFNLQLPPIGSGALPGTPTNTQGAGGGPGAAGKSAYDKTVPGNNDKMPALKAYGHDLTEMCREGKMDPVIGRKDEVERLILILCRRRKNNPVLVGEAGVGKTAIVEGLAQAIAKGEVPDNLRKKKLITLDLPLMIAGTKYRGQFEERIKAVKDEIKAILVPTLKAETTSWVTNNARAVVIFVGFNDQIIDVHGGNGIKTGCRFVIEKNFRIVVDQPGKRGPFSHPPRKI